MTQEGMGRVWSELILTIFFFFRTVPLAEDFWLEHQVDVPSSGLRPLLVRNLSDGSDNWFSLHFFLYNFDGIPKPSVAYDAGDNRFSPTYK